LRAGDFAVWYNPNQTIIQSGSLVDTNIYNLATQVAESAATEVILEVSGTKLAALSGGAAMQGGGAALHGGAEAGSVGLAAIMWWFRNRRAAAKATGFAKGTAIDAVRNLGRIDHAGEHLFEQGIIAGTKGSKAFREAVRSHAIRILEDPLKTFDHVIGGQQVKGFYGMIDGRQVVFFIAKEPRGKIGVGELVTAYMPGPQQIINWGL
jgi:hypothetical protein